MSIRITDFGTMPNGADVYSYTMTNKSGASVTILNLGGIIQKLRLPGKDGGRAVDVVCGFDTVEGYLNGGGCHGALIGRYANRIRNGVFTLNGVEYSLPRNEKDVTSLHGNNEFNRAIWHVAPIEGNGCDRLRMSYVSPDGKNGFPGELKMTVTYYFNDENELKIHYEAVSSKDTIASFTNHTYFNLAGYDSGSVFDHKLMINSSAVTDNDPELCLPTGDIIAVEDMPGFDFRSGPVIADNVALADPAKLFAGGYDHNFILDRAERGSAYERGMEPVLAARLTDPKSGRSMEVYTDLPGVQLYTSNMMKGDMPLKGGVPQVPHTALCLETQLFPDTPNHPEFPSAVIKADTPYSTVTIFKLTY